MSKKIFIGTSGWNYRHWKDTFYPAGIKQKDWFDFYSTKFNTVEVNFSFYRWPKEETIKNWEKKLPEDFIYTLKAPRQITHVKRFKDIEKQVKDFTKLFNNLKKKKGAILFQLPPSFRFNQENLERVKKLINLLDITIINIIEFREKNWWRKEVYGFSPKFLSFNTALL